MIIGFEGEHWILRHRREPKVTFFCYKMEAKLASPYSINRLHELGTLRVACVYLCRSLQSRLDKSILHESLCNQPILAQNDSSVGLDPDVLEEFRDHEVTASCP